jgi:AcrR family transcriptional regulator
VKNPDVRKQEILDGAIKIFARKGYEKTTTADISKELNISQGLCYRYYPTKEAIYDAALERYADFIVEGNLSKINRDVSLKELIDVLTNHQGDLRETEREDKELYALFHSYNSQKIHNELFLKVAAKIIPCVQKYLRQAKQNGEISIEDTDGAAIVGVYGWVGLFLTKELTDEERNDKMKSAWYHLLGL